MATTIGALRVELSANIAKFEAAMGKAAKHMARTQRSFERFGTRASAAGRSLSVGLTAPLVAVGALAAKSFLSFERGMNKVAAVSGATEAEMAELTAIAKDLGATTSFSAAQAAEGLGFLAQAGFDATEAGRALPGVLQLAAAGGIELAAAADIATNVLAGYGLEVDQLARVNDVLAKASISTNTNVQQMGEAFKFAGVVASSAGISFEEAGAAMALMGNAGIQAEMSGTSLQQAIFRLVEPTAKAAGVMKDLGIHGTDAHGRLLPLDQIVEQLEPHFKNTAAMATIFGSRAIKGMGALVAEGSDKLRALTTELEHAGGTAQEVADKKFAGLTGAWTRLQSATEGVLIEIGSRLSPVLERLAATITDRILPAVRGALDAFGRLSPEVQQSRILWLGFAAALGPALLAMGGVALALTPLVPLFGRIWIAAGRMSNALVKALVHPIATAQALRARVVTLRTSLAGLSLSARASAVGVALGSKALTGLRFAIRGVIAALGPMILVFAAFEFAAWAAGALKLGDKLKRLVGITDDAADAARDADAAYEGLAETLAQTTLATERQALAALERGYRDLVAQLERARESNKRAVPGLLKRVRAQEQAIAAAQDRVKAAQQEVEAEQAAARAATDYTEALQAAEKEAAGITDTTGKQIRAARTLGVSLEELSKKFGISTEALKIYLGELDGADTPVDDLGDGVGTLSDEVQTLVDRLRGTGAIQAAHDWAAALDHVGGLTMLTDDETRALVTTLETAITKWRALGEAVPVDVFERYMEASDRVRLNPPEQVFTQLGFEIADLHPTAILAAHQQRLQAFRDMLDDARLTVGNLPPIGIPLEPEITPRFRTTIESALTGFGAEIGPTFARALEGGGNFLGAAQSLGVQGGNRLGDALSGGLAKKMTAETGVFSKGIGKFFGGAMGQAIPFLGPLIGMGIGKIFGLFKKPSEAELAARKHAKDYEDTIIKRLNASQLEEAAEAARGHWAGNERGAQFLIGVRDAYVAAGKSAAAGEQAVGRYWKAVRDGSPEAVGAIKAQIDAVVQVGREQQQRLAELGALKEAGQTAFNPALIEPYLEKLLETGTITQQQAAELRALADEAHVDYRTMQQAAEKYGVKLSALGPAFDQARISDAASVIVTDFELLTQEGANVNGVLRGMQDEVQDLVSDALTAGVAIPEGMRPILESLVAQGRLTDEDGHKLEDLSRIDFAAPLAAKFDTLIDKLTALIEKITGPSGVTQAIDAIPTDIDIDVGFDVGRLHLPDFRSIQIPARVAGLPALQHGGLVTRPTLATFAEGGPEVAIPLDRMEEFRGGRRVEAQLAQLHQDFALLIDEFRHGLDPRRRERALVAALSTT